MLSSADRRVLERACLFIGCARWMYNVLGPEMCDDAHATYAAMVELLERQGQSVDMTGPVQCKFVARPAPEAPVLSC